MSPFGKKDKILSEVVSRSWLVILQKLGDENLAGWAKTLSENGTSQRLLLAGSPRLIPCRSACAEMAMSHFANSASCIFNFVFSEAAVQNEAPNREFVVESKPSQSERKRETHGRSERFWGKRSWLLALHKMVGRRPRLGTQHRLSCVLASCE